MSAELKIKELQSDLDELKSLSQQAVRSGVKQFINTHTEKLQQEINRLQKSESERQSKVNTNANTNQVSGVYSKKM